MTRSPNYDLIQLLQNMLEVTKTQSGHPDIIEVACCILANLALNIDNRVLITSTGGIPVNIATTLVQHISNQNSYIPYPYPPIRIRIRIPSPLPKPISIYIPYLIHISPYPYPYPSPYSNSYPLFQP